MTLLYIGLNSIGPMLCGHCDGYDKLKLPIHECIDGYVVSDYVIIYNCVCL